MKVQWQVKVPGIIGDVLQNLRAALDQAACCLASQNNPTANINDVGFPIKRNIDEFRTHAMKSIKKLSPEAIDFIKAMKPYGGGEERFWILHRLSVRDRHQLLLPAWGGYQSVGLKPILRHPTTGEKIDVPRIFLNPADRFAPLEDGSVFYTRPIDDVESRRRLNSSLMNRSVMETQSRLGQSCQPSLIWGNL
jgi:hypothetical protein